MNDKILLFILLAFLFSSLASAKTIVSPEYQVNLVEVYSSQGCSSCPPAERWLSQFKHHRQLFKSFIPLNFHVDYWDHLGWKDPYANAIFSQRQRRYNVLGHTRTVATPGFIVNGKGWSGWFSGQNLPLDNKKKVGRLTVKLKQSQHEEQKMADIHFDAAAEISNNGRVHVAILAFEQVTVVAKGENKGKWLPHDFVVIGYRTMAMTQSNNSLTAKLELPSVEKFESTKKALVAWISTEGDPSPVQAAGGWL